MIYTTHHTGAIMKQVQITKQTRRTPQQPIDTRTPSGTRLPY